MVSKVSLPRLAGLIEFTATPVRQHAVQSRAIAFASSGVTGLRLLYLTKSSREVMTCGRFEMVKTV
jgi:hypothetical protein